MIEPMSEARKVHELTAGRDLDALVAEKVFGLVRCRGPYHDAVSNWPNTYCFADPDSPAHGAEVRQYSTDIADAWEVVGKMREEGWMLTLSDMPGESIVRATASFAKAPLMDPYHPEANAVADGPALAICLAALSSFPDSTKEGEPK